MKRIKTDINTEQIMVRVSPELKTRLDTYCELNGLSIAEVVRCRLLGFLDAEGKKNKKQEAKP